MIQPGVAKSFVLAWASTALLFVLGVDVPLAGALLLPLVPQPALAFGVKHGRGKAVTLLLSVWLSLFFVSSGLAIGFSLPVLVVIALFACFGRGWSVESVVAGSAGAVLAVVSAALVSFFGSLSRLREAQASVLKDNIEISLALYEGIGLSADRMEILRERAHQTIEVVLQIMPALTFAGLVIAILVNLFFLYRRFPDRRSFFGSAGDLREWRSPESLIWCFILSGFALFLPGPETFKIAALNLFLIMALFYFLQGLAIIAYYFHYKKVPFFVQVLTYVLIVLEQFLTLLVAGLGLFDLWGDFRRLKKKDLNPSRVT